MYLKNIKQLDKLYIPRHIEIHCEVQGFWYVFWGISHTTPQFWWPWMMFLRDISGLFPALPRVSGVSVDRRSEVTLFP